MRLLSLLFVLLSVTGLASASEIRVWGPATTCPEVLTVPTGLNDATQIAAGLHHVIALKANGTVVAWGKNDLGQLNVPAGLTGVVKIQAGGESSLAIRGDGTFVMWGGNFVHQIDIPPGLSLISSGAVSFYDTIAILPDGSLRQWGDFASGTLPSVTTAQEAGIEAGLGLVRLADQSIVLWHDAGQPISRLTALTPPSGLISNRLFGPMYETAISISPSGALEIWGQKPPLITGKPSGLSNANFTDIAIGVTHILAKKLDGTMFTWGSSPSEMAILAIPSGWSSPSRIVCGKQFSAALWTTIAPNGSTPNSIHLNPAFATPGTVTGTTIGTLTATDGDPGDRHVFTLISGSGDGDNGLFSINGHDLVTNQVIPSNKPILSIRVLVTDSGGMSLEKSLSIETQPLTNSPTADKPDSSNGSGGCGLGSSGAMIGFLLLAYITLRKFT